MEKKYVYHEQQESLLCGQHCLNNLLQGPHFTAVDLAEIAQELDEQERQIGGFDSSSKSANVDESGNFSIQVLRLALQRYNGIELATWFHKAGTADIDPLKQQAFIVNRSEHWFTIRKIRENWWNLNSSLEAPETISQFHLTAFLSQLRADGYSVFLVNGKIPEKGDPALVDHYLPQGTGVWHEEAKLLGNTNGSAKEPNFQAFQGKGNRLGGDGNAAAEFINLIDENHGEMDEELQMAIAISASLQQQHAKPAAESKDDIRAKRLAALAKQGF